MANSVITTNNPSDHISNLVRLGQDEEKCSEGNRHDLIWRFYFYEKVEDGIELFVW